jgi:hypothetical protein
MGGLPDSGSVGTANIECEEDNASGAVPLAHRTPNTVRRSIMPLRDKSTSEEARQGERMIEVKVRFFTNALGERKGSVLKKHAWTCGMVRLDTNQTHGIKSVKPRPFNSLLDLGSAVEKVLMEHGIILHASRKMRKYITCD